MNRHLSNLGQFAVSRLRLVFPQSGFRSWNTIPWCQGRHGGFSTTDSAHSARASSTRIRQMSGRWRSSTVWKLARDSSPCDGFRPVIRAQTDITQFCQPFGSRVSLFQYQMLIPRPIIPMEINIAPRVLQNRCPAARWTSCCSDVRRGEGSGPWDSGLDAEF